MLLLNLKTRKTGAIRVQGGLLSSLFFVAYFLLGSSGLAADGERNFTTDEISALVNATVGAGWTKKDLKKLYGDRRLKKVSDLVKMNVTKPIQLKHSIYEHYTNGETIDRAVEFRRNWRTQLSKASKKYKVDEEVIVGILCVETNFGLYKGDHVLLSVFSSIYVDSRNLIKKGQYSRDRKMKKRLEEKRDWALHELKSVLHMGKHRGFDLFQLKGSYAGAFGLPQFLPSSYLKYAATPSGVGRANLYWEPDAIHSVARYLKGHGFKKGQSKKKNDKAIWHYNHSDVYVDTVMQVAKAVKKESKSLASR